MILQLGFFVPGPCVPLARARVVRARGKAVRSFTPEKSQAYKQHVATRALASRSYLEGWRLDWARYHVEAIVYRDQHGADLDNCLKGLLDGMQGVVFANDLAVVSISGEFVDCEEGFLVNDGQPWVVGVRVVVEMVGEQDVETARRARERLLAKVRRASAGGA